MKIVSFNLRHGGVTRSPNSWEKLLEDFQPDIVLAQESFDLSAYFSGGGPTAPASFLWEAVPDGNWGSVVASPRLALRKIDVPSLTGWVSGTICKENPLGGNKPLVVFSLHTPTPGNYEKNTLAMLDAVAIAMKDLPPCDLIIGGDLNVTTALRHPDEELKNSKGELKILERLRLEFGLLNAWQSANPNSKLPQTLRWSGNKSAAYHCDGLFIPEHRVGQLSHITIGNSEDWASWSDHNPIAASLAHV